MAVEVWRVTARHADGTYGQATPRAAESATLLDPVFRSALSANYPGRPPDGWTLLTAECTS